MKKYVKVDNYDFKDCKSTSVSSSDSCTNTNCNSKTNWKRVISSDGTLFYAKYLPESSEFRWDKKTNHTRSQNSFKLAAVKNEEIKEVDLVVSSLDRYRFGRRSSIIESMLGFGVIPFPDNVECLMVANIIDNSIKVEYPHINEGDWFKSLESIEVRAGNIDRLLMQYTRATKVKLIFKGLTHHKIHEETSIFREINNFDDFTYSYKCLFENRNNLDNQKSTVFSTLIISREYFKSDNTECIFYYPYIPNNFLHKARGSFLTLDSVINNDLRSKSIQSTVVVEGTKYYITYGHVGSNLVVCAFSADYQNNKAAKSNGNDFVNFLKFNISEFHSLQSRQYLTHICEILRIKIENSKHYSNLYLSSYLNSSISLSLPKEAQLRICDALSELESMDYKKWNESQETSRDLIVCGSALYYSKYLVTSNLPVVFRTNLECFLRLRGITEFVLHQNVKEMYIWEEMNQFDNQYKHFLAICIHNYFTLVVVLKSTLVTKSSICCISYMEEITDTMAYLISCGIESISEFWVNSSKRPSINPNKTNSQVRQKFKFMHQREVSSENIDYNYPLCESPPHSFSQSEEGCKKKPESALDWQIFSNKNEFRELDQSCHYVEPLLNEVKNMMPLNLTMGWSNDLKYFLHLNFADAVIMVPFKPMCADLQLGAINEYILVIHEMLQTNTNLKKLQDNALSLNKSVTAVKEHSISVDLINSSGSKESIVIVGRLFSFPLKEVYVCFGQNISQNLVELSFRMSFLNIG